MKGGVEERSLVIGLGGDRVAEGDILEPAMYLARKSYDVQLEDGRPVVLAKADMTDAYYTAALSRYRNGNSPWPEMDRYWAMEHVALLHEITTKGITYPEYLPGKKYIATRFESILARLGHVQDGQVAEIGCGTGICLVELAAEHGAAKVHGFDKSYGALNMFKFLAGQYSVGEVIEPRQGDFYQTGYQNDSFDVVFNSGVFEHLSWDHQCLLAGEMVRILKPEGIIMIAVPNPHSPLHTSSRERELAIFDHFVHENPESYLNPLSRHKYAVDLDRILKTARADVIETGAVSTAPSVPLEHRYLEEGLGDFYRTLPRITSWKKFPEDAFRFWEGIEIKNPKIVERFGWYHYAVGRKPE